MSTQFTEALESRTLLSAAPAAIITDELTVAGNIQSLHADVRAFAPIFRTDFKALAGDLRALAGSRQNVQLLGTLRTDQNRCTATLRSDVAHLTAVDRPALSKLRADGLRVFRHPTDLTATARLAGDILAFGTASAAPAATFTADLAGCSPTLAADASALVAANPTSARLASDLQKTQMDVATATSTVQSGLAKTETDVGTLVTDLNA